MADDSIDKPVVVIDNGSGTMKAGLAGDDFPHVVFPSKVGRLKLAVASADIPDTFVGAEAQDKREVLSLNYPIQRGIISNWEDMEKIWQYTYDELGVASDQQAVLHTETVLNPKMNREKMMQIMFETFNVPYFGLQLQGMLALICSGRVSGMAVDCGDGVSHVISKYEGHTFLNAIDRVDVAGSDLTNYLSRLLNERDYCFSTTAEREIVKDMKEKMCYVACDYDRELATFPQNGETEEYELPDGSVIKFGEERFRCPEALFQPSLIGRESLGIHEIIFNSLRKCDIDARGDLGVNIILCGGSTMYPGLRERLQKEMTTLLPSTKNIKVIAPPERMVSVWIGGSVIASLSMFPQKCISRQQYDEHGPGLAHDIIF